MGNKRTIKSKFNKCFACNHEFTSYKEKNISKIDVNDIYKMSNSVVVCPTCQQAIIKGLLKLYLIQFTFKDLVNRVNNRELAEKIRNKIYNTRRKYSSNDS